LRAEYLIEQTYLRVQHQRVKKQYERKIFLPPLCVRIELERVAELHSVEMLWPGFHKRSG
jgi:hypothetical protein